MIARREKVKLKCHERHNQLLASQAYQEFNRDADEASHSKQTDQLSSLGRENKRPPEPTAGDIHVPYSIFKYKSYLLVRSFNSDVTFRRAAV